MRRSFHRRKHSPQQPSPQHTSMIPAVVPVTTPAAADPRYALPKHEREQLGKPCCVGALGLHFLFGGALYLLLMLLHAHLVQRDCLPLLCHLLLLLGELLFPALQRVHSGWQGQSAC